MNKIQKVKTGNELTCTVPVMGSNGLPVNLEYIKSLSVKLAKQGGSTYSLSPTISGNTMTIELTYITGIGTAGMYSLQISGYDANGNPINWSDQFVEVSDDGADVTTFERTIVIPGITQPAKDAAVIVQDGDVIHIEDGMKVIGTGIDEVTLDYPVEADFNATALLSFDADGSTHDATMPAKFRYVGTLPTEAVSKTYLYTWVRGVLSIAEVKILNIM